MKRFLSFLVLISMIFASHFSFVSYAHSLDSYIFLKDGKYMPQNVYFEDGKYVAQKAYLGVEVEKSKNIGVEIKEVPDTGRAYQAGIRSGDVIIEFNGKQIKSVLEVEQILKEVKDGTKIEMKLLRRGSEYTAEVTKNTTLKGMGLIIESATLSKTGAGVNVSKVLQGGPAEKAGIQEGDMIVGLDLKPTLREHVIEDILDECKIGEFVSLEYLRNGEKYTTEVELGIVKLSVAGFDTFKDIFVRSGDTCPLFTIEVEGDLADERSIPWILQNGGNGLWIEKNVEKEVKKGLRVETHFDDEKKVYTSTLWADGITNKNSGRYNVRIIDKHGLMIQSNSFTINVY